MPFLTHLENLYQDQIKGSIKMIEPAEKMVKCIHLLEAVYILKDVILMQHQPTSAEAQLPT